ACPRVPSASLSRHPVAHQPVFGGSFVPVAGHAGVRADQGCHPAIIGCMNFRIWTRRFTLTILWVVLFLLAAWETLAIYYSNLPEALRPWAAGLFASVALLVLLWKYPEARFRRGLMGLMALVLVGWFNMPASNERSWQTDLAVLASADINGDEITVHNIRNCDYRSETDFTCQYDDKTFHLSRLKHVDFFLVYWGSPSIAHT